MESRDTFKIYIGNLAPTIKDIDLHELFLKYGNISEAVVVTGRNYGFVHMTSESQGLEAIQKLEGIILHGQKMLVQRATARKDASIRITESVTNKVSENNNDDLDDLSECEIDHLSYSKDEISTVGNRSSEQHSPLSINNRQSLTDTPDIFDTQPMDECNDFIINQEYEFICDSCDEKYDNLFHVPKILSCNHTFCLDCLTAVTIGNKIKCPKKCPYVTILNESGVTGLTTNQTKIPLLSTHLKLNQFDNSHHNQSFTEDEVCLICMCKPPKPMCVLQKHEFITESIAFDLVKPKLKILLNQSFTTLRSVMAIKANLKERMQYTLHSLNKFSEELKHKIEAEDLDEKLYQNNLENLNDCTMSLLNTSSITDMLSMLHKIETFHHQINNQHTICHAKNVVNGALDSILLKLNSPALKSCLSLLGFSREEAFSLSSSLRESAEKGNFANVLLIYLLCDLLSFRYRPLLHESSITLRSPDISPFRNSPVSPFHLSRDTFDINQVLETTEAIESSRSDPTPPPPPSTTSDQEKTIVESTISLGLSNVTLLPTEEKSQTSPVSYVTAAKKPPKPPPTPLKSLAPSPSIKSTGKFPHCWMVLSMNGIKAGRIVFQLRPDMAPKMCDNFIGLCTGRCGYGYKGTHFFKGGDGFLIGGDVEKDDGSGGYSVFNRSKFEADLCPLRDDVGMIRFRGNGTSDNGRGMVGSQFMIWYAERDFKKFSFSLVFGRIVDGLQIVQDLASHNLHNVTIKVEECGAI